MNSNKKYGYVLRFTIVPGWFEDERIEELLKFCEQAQISEVVVFLHAEDHNTGHITFEELDIWLRMLETVFNRLRANGIVASVNLWETLSHADRGRVLKSGQNWTRMVSYDGCESLSVVCPLDKDWQDYYLEVCRRIVTLKPNVFWIEDDFRYHNHLPVQFGCFCEKHLQEFSKKLGYTVDRETFVKEMLATGKPTPARKVWLDTARKTFVDLANRIGDAIGSVSPSTKVGLMSSAPQWHCVEGRDWEGLLKGFAGKNKPVSRPHLPAYENVNPQVYCWNFNQYSTLTAHLLPENTLIYPELENFPYSLYVKSQNMTRFQLESTLVLPADGIALNIFDFTGNGVIKRFGYEKPLSQIKKYMDATLELNLKNATRKGVIVPFRQDSSYSTQTKYGQFISELMPQDTFWASQLSSFGIANTYSDLLDCKGETIAISGQFFRNLNQSAVYNLFENNNLILDGSALETLVEMGFGELAGVTGIQNDFYPEDGRVSYEEVVNNKSYAGLNIARCTLQAHNLRYISVSYTAKAKIYSVAKNYLNEKVGPCVVIYNNVCIVPFDVQGARNNALLSDVREEMLKEILCEMTFDSIAMTNCPFLTPYQFETKERNILVLINFSDDEYSSAKINGIKWKNESIHTIDRLTGETRTIKAIPDGTGFFIDEQILPMSTFVLWQEK